MLEEQRDVTHKGGTMRLGAQPCASKKARAAACYGETLVRERHRHRYEFNSDFQSDFEAAGFVVTGVNPDQGLAEIVELRDHPWFVAVQFHPEFSRSRNTRTRCSSASSKRRSTGTNRGCR